MQNDIRLCLVSLRSFSGGIFPCGTRCIVLMDELMLISSRYIYSIDTIVGFGIVNLYWCNTLIDITS